MVCDGLEVDRDLEVRFHVLVVSSFLMFFFERLEECLL